MKYTKNILIGIVYALVIIWTTLYVIRFDVSQQLNKSYEIRDTHKQELEECYQQLGAKYEID